MNDRIVKSNGEAPASFVARKAEIDDLLSRIHGVSADHFNASTDDVWDAVFAAHRIAQIDLRNAVCNLQPVTHVPEHV